MKFTGYITVRLNSTRVPEKSIKTINNSSLINTAIKKLNNINDIDNIILYCSNKKLNEYIDNDLKYNFVSRSKEFDGDFITFNNILDSIINEIDTEYVVFLSATSPFIKEETINDMIDKIKTDKYDSAFLAYEINNFCWYNNEPLNYDMSNVHRTQDLVPIVVENSGLYIFSTKLYKKYKRRIGFNPYIKTVDVLESWDIDTKEDLKIAQILGEINK